VRGAQREEKRAALGRGKKKRQGASQNARGERALAGNALRKKIAERNRNRPSKKKKEGKKRTIGGGRTSDARKRKKGRVIVGVSTNVAIKKRKIGRGCCQKKKSRAGYADKKRKNTRPRGHDQKKRETTWPPHSGDQPKGKKRRVDLTWLVAIVTGKRKKGQGFARFRRQGGRGKKKKKNTAFRRSRP